MWPSSADSGRGITSGTFYGNLLRYFKAGGAAASRRPHLPSLGSQTADVRPVSRVEQVSRFLDHSSLAVTTVYLRQLEGDRDTTWQQVAKAIDV